ncbi:hypothetical protein AMK22_30310 [Streptomyces sp. CB01580]|nr:hypothetical protein AMK22_30310 [Streptomyces sp. CB01580]
MRDDVRASSSQAGSTTSCQARRSSRSPRWTREFVEDEGGTGDGGAGDGADAVGAEGDVLQGAPALLEFGGGAFAEGAGAAMRGVGGADRHARETPTSATTTGLASVLPALLAVPRAEESRTALAYRPGPPRTGWTGSAAGARTATRVP